MIQSLQCSKDDIIFRTGFAYFCKVMLNCTVQLIQQHGFIVKRVQVLNWHAAHTFHQLKTFDTSGLGTASVPRELQPLVKRRRNATQQ